MCSDHDHAVSREGIRDGLRTALFKYELPEADILAGVHGLFDIAEGRLHAKADFTPPSGASSTAGRRPPRPGAANEHLERNRRPARSHREFNMARSWILRECVALGFPLFVEQVRQRRRTGLVPRGEYQNPDVAGPRRGPRSDGRRADRWVSAPVRRG